MLDQKTKLAKTAFSAAILKTFGKLSEDEIGAIDGQPDRLVIQLMEQYGLHEDVAQRRVEGFRASLLTEAKS